MSARSERVKSRIFGGLFSLAWMWPLIGPIADIVQGKVPHPVLGSIGIFVFIGLYLVVVVNGFDDAHPQVTRVDLAMLGALVAVGFALAVAYGDTQYAWANMFLYISVSGAAILGPKATPVWVGGTIVLLVVYSVLFSPTDLPPFAVGEAAFETVLASILVHTVKQLLRYIRILHATRSRLAQVAVDEERLRFARDMHDLLGHTLSVIVVKAEVVRRMVEHDPQAAARAAGDIETIGRQALAEVRQAVDGYRPPQFDTELPRITGALQDAGIAVLVTRTGEAGPLDTVASTALGWAVREATTNVIRHSHARSCDIRLSVTSAEVRLEVIDDGPAPSAHGRAESPGVEGDGSGAGLVGLGERLRAVGGRLDAGPRSGGGFRLVATVPVEADGGPGAGDAVAGGTGDGDNGADGTRADGTRADGSAGVEVSRVGEAA